MTTSKRLAAFRADHAPSHELEANELPATEPGDEENEDSEPEEEEQEMTAQTNDEAIATAVAAATAAANARFSAVLGSEHYAGRETLAQTLLGNDKLTAEEITAALAVAPKAAAPAAVVDEDDAQAREDMRARLAAEQPAGTADAGNEAEPKEDNSLVDNMKARFPNLNAK